MISRKTWIKCVVVLESYYVAGDLEEKEIMHTVGAHMQTKGALSPCPLYHVSIHHLIDGIASCESFECPNSFGRPFPSIKIPETFDTCGGLAIITRQANCFSYEQTYSCCIVRSGGSSLLACWWWAVSFDDVFAWRNCALPQSSVLFYIFVMRVISKFIWVRSRFVFS